jgi:hypothetical protein
MKQLRNAILTTIKTALSQHIRYVALLFHKSTSCFHVPAEKDCCHDGSGHNLGITNPALYIFVMMKSFQNIVTQAKMATILLSMGLSA